MAHSIPKTCLTVAFVALLGACQQDTATPPLKYDVEVTRTEFGVPHIRANDYASLGYGEAYAAAEDHVCNMAVALTTAQGTAAEHLGPGHDNANIYSDMVMQALSMRAKGKAALAKQPAKIRQWIDGYAAGYNRYLADSQGDYGSWCDQMDWVKPASAEDFMTKYVALVHTITRMAGAVAAAQPPRDQAQLTVPAGAQVAALEAIKLEGMGSNGWAFGSEATETGKGALLANPHYPWYGTSRFWEKHLTIPGELDVYGAGLIGTPGVAIGFNKAVAWTHTVSDSKRVTLYRLTLNPENPTQYRYEDEWRDLTSVPVSVKVKTDSGIIEQSGAIWFSHHGPMVQMPGLTWGTKTAYAARDANSENTQVLGQWLAMGQAQSMDEFIEAHRTFNAMPWVNTISTSAEGRAVYFDNTNVGHLSQEAIKAWQTSLEQAPQLKQLFLTKGLVILDGSSKRDEWLVKDGVPIAGTTPFDQRPLIESRDTVFNSNDSYWLSDPDNPRTGYSPLYGATETPRSIRTRMNIHLLKGLNGFDFRGDDGKFSIEEIQQALFDNSGLTAHLLMDELLEACAVQPQAQLDGSTVSLKEACVILANWDKRYNNESEGAVLFREWLTRYDYTATQFPGPLFKGDFDPSNPATTPVGLADTDRALKVLAEAVNLLTANKIALDKPLGELQFGHRAGTALPVHGGNRFEGIANLQVTTEHIDSPIFSGTNDRIGDSKTLSSSGYNIAHGSSFIMTMNFTDEGPKAQALLSYSQSGAPSSAHFTDQTERYGNKAWRDIRFTQNDIDAGTLSRKTLQE
jgi:acyl-homoserine-lactone acylase